MRTRRSALALGVLSVLIVVGSVVFCRFRAAAADDPRPAKAEDAGKTEKTEATSAWTTAVRPKPLDEHVKKGLAWLVEHQHKSGGWTQGEESPQMRGGTGFVDTPDVADTCIAALALIRAGNTPSTGPYRDAVAKAVRYVRGQVEASDSQSLSVTSVQGTRVQMKLGPNIDTFLASLLLAEVKGRLPDEEGNRAVDLALNKVIGKIKKHQKDDGTWDNRTGWAPILAQSVGGKGLNRAAQAGAQVPAEILARAEKYAMFQVAQAAAPASAAASPARIEGTPTAGPVAASRPARAPIGRKAGAIAEAPIVVGLSAGAGSAGVELYDKSASLSVLQESVNTNQALEREVRKKAETAKDAKERNEARQTLERFETTRRAHREAQTALLGRLDDPGFVAGFGSNGGEEFLSYMNISESLVVKGGTDWKRWDDGMASNLGRVQNDDGSWSGHHCITGRTFCTATALLVLMADRTPVPVTAKNQPKEKADDTAAAR